MQKFSLVTALLVASVMFSGCSLLGGTDEAEVAPVSPVNDAVMQEPVDTQQQQDEVTPPVALPDPAADQKGLQETQDDAPTGVPAQ